jgi:hypothetical protein
MLNLDGVSRFCLFRHFFPDRINVGSVKIASAVPTPTPNWYAGSAPRVTHYKEERKTRTLMWTGHKVNRFTLLFSEQTVVRAKP